MGGKASIRKGKVNEYKLRDYFRTLGFESHRVPCSGAAQGAKGDVTLTKDGTTLLAELKVRQNEFKSIYAMYYGCGGGPLSISSPLVNCTVSDSFTDLGFGDVGCNFFGSVPIEIVPTTLKKLASLEKLVKECHFLVIKIDYKPFLFIRFF